MNKQKEVEATEFFETLNHLIQFLKPRYPKVTFRWCDMEDGEDYDGNWEPELIAEWEGRLYDYATYFSFIALSFDMNNKVGVYDLIKAHKETGEEHKQKGFHPLHLKIYCDIIDCLDGKIKMKGINALNTFILN